MSKKISLYIDAPFIKRGRKLGIAIADFFLCLILSLLLFFATDAINTAAGGFIGVGDALAESESSMKAMIKASHLDKENSGGNLVGIQLNSTTYVLTLTYASLLEGGMSEEEIANNTYKGYEPINAEKDNCYYYYATFKTENSGDFAPISLENNLSKYLSSLKEGRAEIFVASDYPYLTLEAAKKIDESYRNPSFKEGKEIREGLIANYKTLLQDAIKDFEAYYTPYIEARNAYQKQYDNLLLIKIAEAFIGYGVAALLLYLLVPILAKNGRTLGNIFLKSAYRNKSGNETLFYQNILRFLVILLEFVGIPALAMLLVYGTQGVNLLALPLFGVLPCFSLLIYSFVVSLLSYLFSFFFKDRKQTLSEMAGGMIQVEGRKDYER